MNTGNSEGTGSGVKRRGFLKGLGFLASIPILGAFRPLAPRTVLPGLSKPFEGDPSVGYVPEGFSLIQRYIGRFDGFQGSDEISFWYKGAPSPVSHNHPLAVYLTTRPQKQFFGTESRDGRVVSAAVAGSGPISATYFDGIWMGGEWNTVGAHALVFDVGDWCVGIRGSRLTGVDFNQLLKVAAGLSFPA